MQRNRVVFWEILHSWHKYYKTARRDGRKSQLCRVLQIITDYYRVLQSITEYYRALQSITEYNRV